MIRMGAVVLCTAFLSGCFVDLLGATAITSTLQKTQLETGKRVIENTADKTARMNLEQAIRAYQADKGYNPGSLNDLAPGYIGTIPVRGDGSPFGYDPGTGRLYDSPTEAMAHSGPTPNDVQKQQQILMAINAYGQATGWYPPTLEALVPNYMPAVPYTDSGQAFVYNNQNGHVSHPNAHLQAQPGSGYSAPRGGAGGPMGEALTGIQMQQQLGNMNQSGTSAAGTRARENINQQRSNQNQQKQNNLLHDLGV